MALRLPLRPSLPDSLQTVRIDPSILFRVSGHATGEPYFGAWNRNRFDDPNPDPGSRFGTCYLGSSLAVAVDETILHDLKAVRGKFAVALALIMARYVIRFTGEPLLLANLAGNALRRLGGHAGLTGATSYTTPKRWSAAIHGHLDRVDGLLYMSRHLNDERAVVLFDRARGKLRMHGVTPLHQHLDFGQVATDLAIGLSP